MSGMAEMDEKHYFFTKFHSKIIFCTGRLAAAENNKYAMPCVSMNRDTGKNEQNINKKNTQ